MKELKTHTEFAKRKLDQPDNQFPVEPDTKKNLNPKLMKLKIPNNQPNKNTTQITTNPKCLYYHYQTQ